MVRPTPNIAPAAPPPIEVRDLTMAYGERVIQRDLNFTIAAGSICAIMGGSGCGKSTLMRHLIGLEAPAKGRVLLQGQDLWATPDRERESLLRRFGVMFQLGALWSSLTLIENVLLPLGEYTDLSPADARAVARFKLALTGLEGFEDYYPSEISGGMVKRAALARAMALDPEILFIDEPSAGLDPISSRRLDDLILELRDSLGTTVVIVTHELPSVFAIADDALFLDNQTRTLIAQGSPRDLAHSDNPAVRAFMNREAP